MTIIDTIITGAITGIGSGLGTTIGVWISQKALLKHLDDMEQRLKQKRRRNHV